MRRAAIWAIRGGVVVVVAALGLVVVGFLAPLDIHYRVDLSGTVPEAYGPAPDADAPFVGLALSGGGARAALFAAAGIEALARRNLLGDITHVSSVSGGGFAASYMAMHPMPACPAEDAAARDACFNAYFSAMRDTVADDYLSAVTWAQLRTPWRMLQPSRRLSSFREALDMPSFLDGADFADIVDSRVYFFNTVSYDTGQRFVFSNTVLTHPDTEGANLLPPSLRALSFARPGQPQATPGQFPLSLAVATSAAFPPYLGPLTLAFDGPDGEPPRFRHLGDGGVLENTGVETLTEAFLARPEPARATIYAFDAGLALDGDASQATHDLSLYSRNLPQFVDVLLTYAGAQRAAHIAEFSAARALEIGVTAFDFLDVAPIVAASSEASPWLSWDGWTACGAAAQRRADSPVERLRGIPTNLRITDCDASLIIAAAEFVVEQCLPVPAAAGCFEGRAR